MDNYEIDFHFDADDACSYGLEVKAGNNTGKSAQAMMDRGVLDYVIYFKGDCNYGVKDNVVTIPLVLAYKFQYDCGDSGKAPEKFPSLSELQAFDDI